MTDLNPETVEYAGFWIRLWAALVDAVLFIVLTYPLLYAIYGSKIFTAYDRPFLFTAGPADLLISWVFPFMITIWLWVKYKATPGKKLFSLEIVDAKTGESLTIKQAVIRYFSGFIALLPLALGYIWVAFDSKKQGWHDKIAGTVVVRSKQRGTEAVQFPQA